jgi:predicted RNA-binding protein YlqC (UPF0109 family)
MPNSRPTVDTLLKFIESAIQIITEHKYEIVRSSDEMKSLIAVEIRVDQRDYAKVTGLGGRNIRAIRTLAHQIAVMGNLPRLQIEVLRPEKNQSR